MRRFVLGWKKLGLEKSLGSRIVTYADDLVILCRKGKAEEALTRMRELMGKLRLTVNEEKTRICKVPQGQFDFLGYTFAPALSSGDDGLEARAPGGTERPGARLRGDGAEPEVVGRHDVRAYQRRLAVPRTGAGLVCAQARRLGDE